jgi:hypothetical protein
MLRNVLVAHAKEAGLEAVPEPDTYDLLLGQFEAKDCKRVFPKRMSAAYEAGFQALSQASDFINSSTCTFTSEQKQTYIQNHLDKLPLVEGAAGLRVDASFRNPETDEIMWWMFPWCAQPLQVTSVVNLSLLQRENCVLMPHNYT